MKMELSEENLAQANVCFSPSTWSSVCWIILEMSISVCYPQATRVGSHNCGALFLGTIESSCLLSKGSLLTTGTEVIF